MGLNYFFRAPSKDHGGDLVYFQGHSSPGLYARAFMEGRLTKQQLDGFRQEIDGKGISFGRDKLYANGQVNSFGRKQYF